MVRSNYLYLIIIICLHILSMVNKAVFKKISISNLIIYHFSLIPYYDFNKELYIVWNRYSISHFQLVGFWICWLYPAKPGHWPNE